MDTNIIKLTPSNWKEFQEMRLKALKTEPSAFSSSYEEEVNRTEEFLRHKLLDSWAYAAEIQDRFIAMARVVFEQSKNLSHVAEIVSFFVDPTYDKEKIGRLLLKKIMLDIYKLSSIVKVRCNVNSNQESAIRICKEIGFTEAGMAQKETRVDGTYYDRLYMELIFEDKLT